MVTILSAGFTSLTKMEHVRCTSPLRGTEQAPHRPIPQPYLVPVGPACSRNAQSRCVSPSTVRVRDLPLTFNLATFGFLDCKHHQSGKTVDQSCRSADSN